MSLKLFNLIRNLWSWVVSSYIWHVVFVFSCRAGCVNFCAGKRIRLRRTARSGRTCPWSAGSSVCPKWNVTLYMSRRATEDSSTMWTDLLTCCTCPPTHYRSVSQTHNILSEKQVQTLWAGTLTKGTPLSVIYTYKVHFSTLNLHISIVGVHISV